MRSKLKSPPSPLWRSYHAWKASTATLAVVASTLTFNARAALEEGLVSYWPLDEVVGTKTPDLVSGYDMELANLTADDLVMGAKGMAFQFDNTRQTMLRRISSPGEQLPINQHPAFTVSFWVQIKGTGQNDLRIFSEGSNTDNGPLFNIGTANNGATDQLDLYFRQAPFPTVDHIKSVTEALDGTWRHIAFIQQEDGSRGLYIDGVLDALEIAAKPEGNWNLNTTTIGGILRAAPGFWVTGAIDEVILWSRAISEAELATVVSEGLDSVFDPLTRGMVAYWPLDEAIGTKTPDIASGYDMELFNLTAEDVVPGRWGNAFRFENARQTMLRRINAPGEELPINQFEAFTLSMWTKVKGTGQNDLRIFSEGSTTDNGPLFNIGTANNGATDQLDLFFRQAPFPTVDHIKSVSEPLDDTWRHIAFVQQENGTRALYVDGVLDGLEIAPKPEGDWALNTTTIGGILRAAPGFWVTGLIDDVALWRRALEPSEIATLSDTGTPVPFSKAIPLAVRSFTSDFPATAVGDTITLRWDVNRNVQVFIDQGVGEVTAQTDSGVGAIDVVLDRSRTFTITIVRGEESESESLSVTAIDGVVQGWTLLDNFDRYAEGNLGDTASWFDLTATGVQVVDRGGNPVAVPNAPSVVAILPLKDLTIEEGESRTLFFRTILEADSFEPIRGVVTLTDKNLRFGTDLNGNDLGNHAIISDEWAVGLIGAMNGFGGFVDFAFTPSLDRGNVYNIWIDVTNGPFPAGEPPVSTGDTFSIWVQQDGGGERVKVIDNYTSNRDPVGEVLLGFTRRVLDRLAFGARAEHSGLRPLMFDDFYLSKSGFLDTVPRAYGFSEPVGGADPEDIVLTLMFSEGGIQIVWEGGVLESAPTVDGPWTPVAGATSPRNVTPSGDALYFRVNQ